MDAPLNQVFSPASFHELFLTWNRFPDAILYAGGTDIIWRQGKNILNLPSVILCLDKLQELHRITRTEQYLEIGSMVKLNKITWLGKIVPDVLTICLENIGGFQLRNIATIGGNICGNSRLFDVSAPLTALDAQYELRNAHSSRWLSASRFHSTEEHGVLQSQELLTRIRLPLPQWDYSIYKKFFPEDFLNSEALVFLAKAQKSVLSDIRVVYKANSIIRNKGGEDILNGKFLPISRRTADDFIENWEEFLSGRQDVSEFSKNALLAGIEENVYNLTE
jgi:CO/xanthine dehydrogenase FAD-binding subunit